MLSKSVPPVSAVDLFDDDDCNGEEGFLRNFEDVWYSKKRLTTEEGEEERRNDLAQPTTKPSSLDGDANTQNDAKKNRKQEERIVALTKEGGHLRGKLGENETQLKEFREQVAALQRALEKRDDDVQSLKNKLEDADQENKLLLDELDNVLLQQQAREEKKSALGVVAPSEDSGALGEANARIEELERELKDSSNVSALQVSELDDEVKALNAKLKSEKLDSSSKLKERDDVVDALRTKLRMYESSVEDETGAVDCLVSTKRKVNEARADAASVRESLKASEERCRELESMNDELKEKGAEAVESKREANDLKQKVCEWTERTYEWKSRAETAERKLQALDTSGGEEDAEAMEAMTTMVSNPQGIFLQAVMEKQQHQQQNNGNKNGNAANNQNRGRWRSLFRSGTAAATDAAGADTICSSTSSDNGSTGDESDLSSSLDSLSNSEAIIAGLKSEVVKLSASHKEELYVIKKKIAQLEGENEALVLQNATLEQLSRFHNE